MKLCSLCGEDKPTSEFHKRKISKDGLQYACIPCVRAKNSEYNTQLRIDALQVLGGRCVECGFSDSRALQIDHVNGGGSQEFKKTNNRNVYRRIAQGETDGYQVLCANCNWIKRSENGEHGNYFLKR